jgi:hypothetical protein
MKKLKVVELYAGTGGLWNRFGHGGEQSCLSWWMRKRTA